ncbi:molybdenum cofactor biosynthesis protein MoaE [Hoyosella sp. G463]|uniref:Molybdenum cofactor biosynthesis protein MoaE n=1 Tax=Lolliginicoccus lacisalsi TaxID=2742202 RepID=A0A927JB41_9ACTN|nr:molybdenum cofactor biosynthesis protein MoaE [Lolliginicoccus lacisalsi]MBD8505831.1 molybdenum cofactor biosynthesis protein MoaE [Lolliginicoccus lacisalsi]
MTSGRGTPEPENVGGAPGPAEVRRASVTTDPLDTTEHERLVEHPAAGAIVTFAGVVRDHDGGRDVTALDYTAHPTAGSIVERVVADIAEHARGVRAIAVSHRIGPLAIGDAALVCAVAADHRAEAFATCAKLVDEIKAQLPVWKRQVFTDGTDEWVNSA